MSSLFNLKKTNPKHVCEAMRCSDAVHQSIPGDLWGKDEVDLCARHIVMAADYAEKAPPAPPTPLAAAAPEQTALALGEVDVPASLGQRAREIIGEVQESKANADETLELVRKLTISSHADMDDVAEYLREVKTFRDKIETKEKEITVPLNAILRRFRELLSPAKKSWTEAEGLLRGLLSQAALSEQQRNQALMDEAARAHAGGADASAPVQGMTTSSDLFGVSVRFVWTVIVEDADKLPEEYTTRTANVLKLKEYAAKFEGKEPDPLPGVRFEKTAPLRVQSVRGVS
jgi:hypothetical protein